MLWMMVVLAHDATETSVSAATTRSTRLPMGPISKPRPPAVNSERAGRRVEARLHGASKVRLQTKHGLRVQRPRIDVHLAQRAAHLGAVERRLVRDVDGEQVGVREQA